MQSNTIINVLNNVEHREFIGQHLSDDPISLVLAGKKYPGIDVRTAATLIGLYQKAKIKLPWHYSHLAALNPKSFEQSTSGAVAEFKRTILHAGGKHLVNLTGGLGVDDMALAKDALRIDSCDIDPEIHELAQYNLHLAGITNVFRHLEDGIWFVDNHPQTDILYADPDRRPGKGRTWHPEEAVPDVLGHMDLFLSKASHVWIKFSPMADVSYLLNHLPGIQAVYVIEWRGEVREVLTHCTRNSNGSPEIISVVLETGEPFMFKTTLSANRKVHYSCHGQWLTEPPNAVIKAGQTTTYAVNYGLTMVAPNSHLLLSEDFPGSIAGRVFRIVDQAEYKPAALENYLRLHSISKANLTTRNFRETPEMLKKRYKLKDGGEDYFFFTTSADQTRWVFHCRKENRD